jgi:hypothetical protein
MVQWFDTPPSRDDRYPNPAWAAWQKHLQTAAKARAANAPAPTPAPDPRLENLPPHIRILDK